MRGLIYKECSLFLKSIGKKEAALVAVLAVLLFVRTGPAAGLFMSVLFAMAVGIQHVLEFSADEQHNWKSYQMIMPVTGRQVVMSKYVSVLLTLVISIVISLILSLVSFLRFGSFDAALFYLTVLLAAVIPLIWTSFLLPVIYWFGFRYAQYAGLILVIPNVYFLNYLEDRSGITDFAKISGINLFFIFGILILIFGISYFISLLGYSRKRK